MRDDLLVVAERLPVRPGPGSLPGRLLPAAEHGVDVAGRHRVVHDPGQVRPVLLEQLPENVLVQRDLPGPRDAAQQGPTGQLVAEGDPVGADLQDLPPLGLLEHPDVPEEGSGQQWLHLGRDDGELLEGISRAPGELPDPGHHGVDDRGRDAVSAAGQHLGDEERVAVRSW